MQRMLVFGIAIPGKPLSNFELERYVKQLKIPNVRGVFMRDALPQYPLTCMTSREVIGCATIETRTR